MAKLAACESDFALAENDSIVREMVGNGEITGTYSFVTIGVNTEKNKSSVHS
jgi:hypothetical protein